VSESILLVLAAVVFMALLLTGRRALAAGANQQVANGATLLVLATVVGVVTLAAIASLDAW